MATSSIRQIIFTEDAANVIGPYSQGVILDKMVFISAEIGINPATGEIVPGGVAEQTDQVIKNLQAILQAAGVGLGNVIKATVYLNDINDFDAFNNVYAEYFTTKYPARALIQAAALPLGALVAIEAVAVTGEIIDQ